MAKMPLPKIKSAIMNISVPMDILLAPSAGQTNNAEDRF
jgi:hypothetical protein